MEIFPPSSFFLDFPYSFINWIDNQGAHRVRAAEQQSSRAAVAAYFLKGAAFSAGAGTFLALGIILAQSINTFQSGEVVSASKINQNFQIAAPQGFIGAFMLSACPSGWIIADGTNGTPDLRGRFIRGRDPGNATGRDPGGDRAAGNAQDDLLASHNHSMGDITRPTAAAENIGCGCAGNPINNHTAQNTGTSGGAETRPKNVALIFCMRQDS